MQRIIAIALAGVAACSTVVYAQNAQPPCATAEYRQFDFWLGEWEVTNQGKLAGSNSIKVILNGCVLLEEWESTTGYVGKSFNRYDADTGKWQQHWVDGQGGVLRLEGGLVDGKMVLAGESMQDGGTVLNRITWTPSEDGTVRQHWESSKDGGDTWATLFDGIYRRVAKG